MTRYKCWTCTCVLWRFYLPRGKYICAIWWHWICAPLIADLFLYCYEEFYDKPPEIQTVWPHRPSSTIPLDISTIYSSLITLNLLTIFLIYIHENFNWIRQILRTKKHTFFDLNIKLIGSNIHTSVNDKRDEFGFPIVNFPWLSGNVPRLPSYGIYISHLVRFARCCTSVFDFHPKNLQITSQLLT